MMHKPDKGGATRTVCFVIALIIPPMFAACSWPGSEPSRDSAEPPPGHAQVAHLPKHDGLQYCINLRAQDLAPPTSRYVYVHSLSAYLSTLSGDPALLAITGRYPGWDTPNTTIYNLPFTNNNTVWLEIDHDFPLGVECLEVYGSDLRPSTYRPFKYRMLVGFSYLWRGRGTQSTKLFGVSWGTYLPQYSPRHRPKH